MQGRGGGWQNLKIVASFLDLGDTFLKPDFAGCCAVEEAGVAGAVDSVSMDCSCSVGSCRVV